MWSPEWFNTIPDDVKNGTVKTCLEQDNKQNAIIESLEKVNAQTIDPRVALLAEGAALLPLLHPNNTLQVPPRRFVNWLLPQLEEGMRGYTECQNAFMIYDKAFRHFWFNIMSRITDFIRSSLQDNQGNTLEFHRYFQEGTGDPDNTITHGIMVGDVELETHWREKWDAKDQYLDIEHAEELRRIMILYLTHSPFPRIRRMLPYFRIETGIQEESVFFEELVKTLLHRGIPRSEHREVRTKFSEWSDMLETTKTLDDAFQNLGI